jgi:hypothetical protein
MTKSSPKFIMIGVPLSRIGLGRYAEKELACA